MHLPPERATVIEVVYLSAFRGDGSKANPERLIHLYFNPSNGEILACYDPMNGPPDSYVGSPQAPKCPFFKLKEDVERTYLGQLPVKCLLPASVPCDRCDSCEAGASRVPVKVSDMNVYCSDDYPRIGCLALIEVTQTGYLMSISAPNGASVESFRPGRSPEEIARMLLDWCEGRRPFAKPRSNDHEVEVSGLNPGEVLFAISGDPESGVISVLSGRNDSGLHFPQKDLNRLVASLQAFSMQSFRSETPVVDLSE
ncbi:MAG: hypothetical protein HGA47_09940 [Zoogloea sp.]|nr:hypothetical protein [Zoogloea sp.]